MLLEQLNSVANHNRLKIPDYKITILPGGIKERQAFIEWFKFQEDLAPTEWVCLLPYKATLPHRAPEFSD